MQEANVRLGHLGLGMTLHSCPNALLAHALVGTGH